MLLPLYDEWQTLIPLMVIGGFVAGGLLAIVPALLKTTFKVDDVVATLMLNFIVFFAMTALDENRARTQLAKKAGAPVESITNLCIWGNHSSTMYPDFFNAKIQNRPATDVIGHREWLEKDFITTVQKRGAAIIEARGLSSAASAANAVVDTVRRLTTPTAAGDWFSVAVCSDGSYGIEKGLMFSYPIRTDGKKWEIVQGLPVNEFSRAKITATENELKEEKSLVSELLPK